MMKTWMLVATATLALLGCRRTNLNFCGDGRNKDDNCGEPPADGKLDTNSGCTSSATCMVAGKMACDVTNGTCVECAGSDVGACTGAMPVCGSDDMCRACGSDAECTLSDTCLPDGSCAGSDAILYASSSGTQTAACTMADPCSITHAVSLISSM
jgi:hypothetical protein